MPNIIIDRIQINTAHFGSFSRREAIKKMLADGFVPGKTKAAKYKWAAMVYDLIKGKQ